MRDKNSIVISGSIAYDNLLFHQGDFKELAATGNNLNLSMAAATMRREFGGCAGNIAYTLNMLQPGAGILAGAAGHDIADYQRWWQKNNIDYSHVLQVQQQHTAQAFIVTDSNNNQLTIFHPGAMDHAHNIDVSEFTGASLAIVSPDGRQAMLQHCQQFHQAKIPFIFDPGQATGMFSGEELVTMIEQSTYVIANEYEWKLLLKETGTGINSIAKKVDAAIITRGEHGAEIHFTNKDTLQQKAVPAENAIDPTGCGDSWRAAMLHGLTHKLDWQDIARLASLVAAMVVEHNGTQNHTFSKEQVAAEYKKQFNSELPI